LGNGSRKKILKNSEGLSCDPTARLEAKVKQKVGQLSFFPSTVLRENDQIGSEKSSICGLGFVIFIYLYHFIIILYLYISQYFLIILNVSQLYNFTLSRPWHFTWNVRPLRCGRWSSHRSRKFTEPWKKYVSGCDSNRGLGEISPATNVKVQHGSTTKLLLLKSHHWTWTKISRWRFNYWWYQDISRWQIVITCYNL